MIRGILTIASLDAVYLVVLGRVSVADALAGAVWAVLFLWWFHRQVFPAGPAGAGSLGRLLAAVPLTAVVLARGLHGALLMAVAAVGRRPGSRGGFIEIPLGERTPSGAAASALFDSMAPGSYAVDIDEQRGVMLIHVLDASDEETIRRDRETFYRRWQRRAIE